MEEPKGALSGFTLVEFMISLAVAATLMGIVLPAMGTLMAKNRMTATHNEILSLFALGRSEAVKQRQRIILCPSSDLSQCAALPQWDQGVILFADTNGNLHRDADEIVLRVINSQQSHISISSSIGRRRVRYFPDGTSPGSNLTLTFCDLTNEVAPKALILSNSGRVRSSDTKADGTPLICP